MDLLKPSTVPHQIAGMPNENLTICLFGPTGCLSGETPVVALRGKHSVYKVKTLKELYNAFNKNAHRTTWDTETPFRIKSMKEGSIRVRNIKNVLYSGERQTFNITVEGHEPVRATADHRFHTPFGYKALSTLVIGDEVTTQEIKNPKGKRTVKHSRAIIKAKYHPYARQKTIAGRVYSSILISWAIIEANMNKLDYPEYIRILNEEPGTTAKLQFIDPNLIVHHKDKNPLNNSIDNLEVLTKEEHDQLHGEENVVNFGKYSVTTAKIISITSYGIEDTFDIEMEDTAAPNFVVNGLIVHNSGKTAQIGELAEYYFKKYKQYTRLYSCDPGGWITIAPYVELGIIELVPYFGDNPWYWVDACVKGMKLDKGKFVPGVDPKIALYAFEGMTSMADKVMLWMSQASAKGINIGGGGAFSFTAGEGAEKMKIGSSNMAHYSVAQQQVYEKSAQSQQLPGTILWTAGDRRGEDDANGGVVGPQIAGKALTAEVPRWFNLTFRIATESNMGQPTKHVLYTDAHTEMNAKMAKGISNARIPLAGGEIKIPEKIEPASIVQVIELLSKRQTSATDAIKKRLGL